MTTPATTCVPCNGDGKIDGVTCTICRGIGFVPSPDVTTKPLAPEPTLLDVAAQLRQVQLTLVAAFDPDGSTHSETLRVALQAVKKDLEKFGGVAG